MVDPPLVVLPAHALDHLGSEQSLAPQPLRGQEVIRQRAQSFPSQFLIGMLKPCLGR